MSLQPAEVRALLRRILADESLRLGELASLLQDEAAIVSGDDLDAITAIGSMRQRCIDALTRLDAERADVGRLLSFGHGRAALARLYQWCDSDGSLNQQWQANLELARRCQKLNDSNGAVVTARLSRVQQLLQVVRGKSVPPVYSARGSRLADLGSRDLGRA